MATATLNDMQILATDTVFGSRVGAALEIFCTVSLPGEAVTGASAVLHVARKNYAANVMGNPTFFKPLFVTAVASNQLVANDACTNGTLVGLTPSQVAVQALLATDADINNAVAAAFNAFIPNI